MSAATTSMEVGGATKREARQRDRGLMEDLGRVHLPPTMGQVPCQVLGAGRGGSCSIPGRATGINYSENDVPAGHTDKGSASWGLQPAGEGEYGWKPHS